MKEIAYSKTAQKVLMRMPRNWAIRIRDKISAYATDPASQASNIKALQGMDGMLRLRVPLAQDEKEKDLLNDIYMTAFRRIQRIHMESP